MDKDTGISYYFLFSLLIGEVENENELESKIKEYNYYIIYYEIELI